MPYPTTYDQASYQRDVSEAGNQRRIDLAANTYARNIARQRRNLKLEDMKNVWTNTRNSFNTPYLRRGFFNSGLRQQGLNQMFKQQTNEQNVFNNEAANQEFEYNQKGAGVESAYRAALRQLQERRQAAIFQEIAGLQALNPIFQGLGVG